VKIGRQVRLLCPWVRLLTRLPLPLSGSTVVTSASLTRKTAKVTSLSPGWGDLANNEQNKINFLQSGGEPFAAPCKFWPVRYLNSQSLTRGRRINMAVEAINTVRWYYAVLLLKGH